MLLQWGQHQQQPGEMCEAWVEERPMEARTGRKVDWCARTLYPAHWPSDKVMRWYVHIVAGTSLVDEVEMTKSWPESELTPVS